MKQSKCMFKVAYQLNYSTIPVVVILPSLTLSAMLLRGSGRLQAKQHRYLIGDKKKTSCDSIVEYAVLVINYISKSNNEKSSNRKERPPLQLIDAAP